MNYVIRFEIQGQVCELHTNDKFTALITARALSTKMNDVSVELWAAATKEAAYENGQRTL